MLKNTKSLGNSLGTANKKSINNQDRMLQGIQNQSTLNDGQFFTMGKTGL